MKILKKITWACFFILIISSSLQAAPKITSSKAPLHVGEEVVACGTIKAVKVLSSGTFLNVGSIFPEEHFSIVIWENALANFEKQWGSAPLLKNKSVCVSGKIKKYKQRLQIYLSNPQFLWLEQG